VIFGLAGQIGAGKDEAMRRAKQLLPHKGVVRVSFAEKLKTSAAALFNIDQSFWEVAKRDNNIEVRILGPDGVYSSMTVREMLQRYGTEAHRDIFGGSFWVDAALPLGFDHSEIVVLVTDTRFPEEVQRVKDLGGKIIRLTNGEMLAPVHASEQILSDDLIDYEIDNSVRDDGFAHLDAQLLEIFEKEGLVNDSNLRRDKLSL